jgi:hypothetical protein
VIAADNRSSASCTLHSPIRHKQPWACEGLCGRARLGTGEMTHLFPWAETSERTTLRKSRLRLTARFGSNGPHQPSEATNIAEGT